MAGLSPFKPQFFDNNGDPLVGGKLYAYAAGTTTPQDTYTDAGETAANTNPVILNSRGEADIWLTPGVHYDFVLKSASDVLIWTLPSVRSYGVQAQESSDGLFGWVNSAIGQLWQFVPTPAINALPKNVRWVLRCLSSGDGAFTAGDYIDITHNSVGNASYQIVGGAIKFSYSQNGVLQVKDKAVAAANVTLTAARWDLKCIAEF